MVMSQPILGIEMTDFLYFSQLISSTLIQIFVTVLFRFICMFPVRGDNRLDMPLDNFHFFLNCFLLPIFFSVTQFLIRIFKVH